MRKKKGFWAGALRICLRGFVRKIGWGGGVNHPHFHPSHTPHNPDLFSKLKG
ncbi:hypothetical protein HHE03_12260 [Helicobacter heilmannii]|nr:hypothetical protein HHE03_12260 [Helicobacter heilmannii]